MQAMHHAQRSALRPGKEPDIHEAVPCASLASLGSNPGPCVQVFMRPPRIMLRNLVGLNQDNAKGMLPSLLGTRVTALYAATTFAMLTITYGAGAALGVVTPVLQVSVPTTACIFTDCLGFIPSLILLTLPCLGCPHHLMPHHNRRNTCCGPPLSPEERYHLAWPSQDMCHARHCTLRCAPEQLHVSPFSSPLPG